MLRAAYASPQCSTLLGSCQIFHTVGYTPGESANGGGVEFLTGPSTLMIWNGVWAAEAALTGPPDEALTGAPADGGGGLNVGLTIFRIWKPGLGLGASVAEEDATATALAPPATGMKAGHAASC